MKVNKSHTTLLKGNRDLEFSLSVAPNLYRRAVEKIIPMAISNNLDALLIVFSYSSSKCLGLFIPLEEPIFWSMQKWFLPILQRILYQRNKTKESRIQRINNKVGVPSNKSGLLSNGGEKEFNSISSNKQFFIP